MLISSKNTYLFNFLRLLFVISIIASTLCEGGFTEESMQVTPVLGLGSGTLAVIIAICIGVVLCVLGMAFPFPGLFIFIGIVIPCIVFIFVIFCPRIEEQAIIEWQNSKVNAFIIARWFHFLIMLLMFLGLAAPLVIYISIEVIPQRVDSRAQTKYDQGYLSHMEREMIKKNNLREAQEEAERLPLRQRGIKRDQEGEVDIGNQSGSRYSNLINNESKEVGVSRESNQLPPSMLPKSTLNNDFQQNRNRFAKFKRKGKGK